jgi:hypothetical protein
MRSYCRVVLGAHDLERDIDVKKYQKTQKYTFRIVHFSKSSSPVW